MKKFLLAAVAFMASVGAAQAQDLFSKGESALNIGIGIGHSYGGYGVSIPPLSVAYDYSLVSNLINGNNGAITLGAYGAYTSASYRYDGFAAGSASHTVLGVRGMFHYQFAPKLDTYAGLMLGYHIASYSSNINGYPGISGSGIDLGVLLGARYFFTDHVGMFTELGYSLPYWNLGVTFKL